MNHALDSLAWYADNNKLPDTCYAVLVNDATHLLIIPITDRGETIVASVIDTITDHGDLDSVNLQTVCEILMGEHP